MQRKICQIVRVGKCQNPKLHPENTIFSREKIMKVGKFAFACFLLLVFFFFFGISRPREIAVGGKVWKRKRDTVTKKWKGPQAKEVFARKLPKHLCSPLLLSLSLTSFTFPFSFFFCGDISAGGSFCVLGNGGAEGENRFTFYYLHCFDNDNASGVCLLRRAIC